MAMNPNMGMANMNPMGGAVGGAPMPMMNNGVAMNPQQAAAAAAAARQSQLDSQRGVLNTYIYEYFLRYEMFDCARSLLSSNQQVNVHKDGKGGNAANGEDPMDTDSKDDLDKLPDGLPPPKLPMPASDSSFLYEWFCLFWDIYNAQRVKGGNGTVNQYVAHTQQQSRLKQNQQQELLRQMRPNEFAQQQYQAQMMRMQNGNMNMGIKQGALARAAIANNQNNPQMMMQPTKQNQMQRDPSGMDQNRDRPSSPASGENAPSPSKRQRIDGGAPFNPNQPGMVANGRPAQGMPGQQMTNNQNMAAAQQMLAANGINPNSLNPQQLHNFINAPPAAQQKSIATYSQNLQQHHGSQMGNKQQMPNAGGPQNQGSPMMGPGPDGTALNAFYNPTGEMGGPGGIRPGPGGAQAAAGSNHALQDYQMQLMLLEQQNKKRLMMARQEQDTITGMPARDGAAPGAPGQPGQGPNGQPFPEASPQAMRSGASPNPADQMKRGTPQMNNSGIPSPVPEGGQSRDSPNPAMNFMGNQVDPNMAPHFFKPGTDMSQAQMNGMRPPSSHPGQPFNSQMNPQQMMAARQMQGQQGQQAGQGAPGQWQQGPNGQPPQGMQQNQQVQGTPQPRSMGPPSAPAGTANANSRTTASPQQAAAAPPTPSQGNKPAPKKKETKAAKEKRAAAAKKASQNANAAGAATAGENSAETEATPATPITSTNSGFNKNAPNGAAGANAQATTAATAPTAPAAAPAPQAAPVPPQAHGDPSQNGMMDNFGSIMEFGSMELANPLQSGDVLNDFDFDSFLHEDNTEPFDFNGFSSMEGGDPIGAD
ncbi:Transcriptional activator somA [Metarhizium brunneum]|uniref:Transcriptional activator somA n=1 Tax=Metarhizium brunneum TaxID=500148 RepID=A0A7D5Z6C1_9HYPO